MNRKKHVSLMAVLTALAAFGCGSEASGEQAAPVALSVNSIGISDFSMEWSMESGEIEITVSAPTTGWIAVGFEPSAAMKDANIIIGYVQSEELFIRDDWGDGHISHTADIDLGGSSDVTAVSGSEENGVTAFTFSIPLNSGDQYDRVLQEGGTYKVILAFGPDDADNFQGYHAWAETIELEL